MEIETIISQGYLDELYTTKTKGFSTVKNCMLIGDRSILRQALLKCIGRGIASSFLASQACGAIGILANGWFGVGLIWDVFLFEHGIPQNLMVIVI